jgi:hypothetical protein
MGEIKIKMASPALHEQANFIRGPQNFFPVSPRPSNILFIFLAILKNTLELEQWTNMNQEFSQ